MVGGAYPITFPNSLPSLGPLTVPNTVYQACLSLCLSVCLSLCCIHFFPDIPMTVIYYPAVSALPEHAKAGRSVLRQTLSLFHYPSFSLYRCLPLSLSLVLCHCLAHSASHFFFLCLAVCLLLFACRAPSSVCVLFPSIGITVCTHTDTDCCHQRQEALSRHLSVW